MGLGLGNFWLTETKRWFCSSLPVAGLPMESLLTNQRCRCRKQTSDVISAWKISFIEVIPRGIQCRRKEIIGVCISLKSPLKCKTRSTYPPPKGNPNPKPQGNSTTTPPPPHLYSLL
uniref:Chemokine interleukin-8-like domain-containing protein n=1 Tax=Terrapene triunguis TaxID=2587831 RepID=A0A674I7H1_9SAUR